MLNSSPDSSLRRLLHFARPETKRLAWGTVFLFLGSAMTLIFPQTVRMAVDEALKHQDAAMVDRLGVAMLAILVVTAIAMAARYYLFTYAGERIVRSIKSTLFKAMLRQDVSFFDQQMTGDLLSRITADATVLQNALSVNISMLLRNAVAAIGGLVLLFVTSAKLTLALLAVLPPAAFITAGFGKRIKGMARQVQEAVGVASSVADETLGNLRTVRAFAAESVEVQRFDTALDQALEKARIRIAAIARFMGLISLLGLTSIAVVLWYGARLVLAGELSIGTLSAYILYTLTVAVSVATLGNLWTDFMSAAGAASRIFQILDRVPQIAPAGGAELPRIEGAIQIDQVTFAYPSRPDVPVLSDLNLNIAPGEIVALVGHSGSGKSTVAALIQRFYDPNRGAVRLDGHDLKSLSGAWLRRQIGTVAQEPVLMSTSLRNNIAYGRPDAPLSDIETVARLSHAEEFILRFPEGYDTRVGERGVQLSGGQRQRVAIARAMLKDPRILILDEATSALDADSEHWVQEALQRLMQGRTVLVIAHRLSTVRHADRVIVLERGRIVQQGSHEELIQDRLGSYYNLVQKQLSQ